MAPGETRQEKPDREEVSLLPTWVYSKTGERIERSEWVIQERPVTIYLNERELVTLLCAGHHLDELGAGFLYGEGFLDVPADMESMEIDEKAGTVKVTARSDLATADRLWLKRTITSGCGKGSIFYYSLDALLSKPSRSGFRISAAQVVDRVEDLNRLSETYRRTHGVHNAVLAAADKVIIFRDDIGRHNAVDMIVGYVFLQGISLEDKLIVTTGRLTSEILIKAAKVGIPCIVSRHTATSLAVELANALNITLIGYARGGKFTVYSGSERIERSHGSHKAACPGA